MIVDGIRQGSDDWHSLRRGVVTASNFGLVLTKGRGKTRRSYMERLLHEIIMGSSPEMFWSEAMRRGTELEPEARTAYAENTGHTVREIAMAFLDGERRIGGSPDGLIGEDGGLEIKCPLPETHEKYLQEGRVPKKYTAQIQGNLWITGRKWWDFVSYAPEFQTSHRMLLRRVPRDEEYIAHLRAEILRFVEELDTVVAAALPRKKA